MRDSGLSVVIPRQFGENRFAARRRVEAHAGNQLGRQRSLITDVAPVAEPAIGRVFANLFDSPEPLIHRRNVRNEDELLTDCMFGLADELQTELLRKFIVLHELLRRTK